MSKVYIVTSGDYSDYRILAVFSTAKLAKAYCDLYNRAGHYSKADYEPWDLDEERSTVESGKIYWEVSFDQYGQMWNLHGDFEPVDPVVRPVQNRRFFIGGERTMALEVEGVVAPDEKSAVKIAAERRAQFLAERDGIA